MNFIISANTDKGRVKSVNQDSLTVKTLMTPLGRMVFAVLCDGMGGLQYGEVASAAVIRAFDRWAKEELPALCSAPLEDYDIRARWDGIVQDMNRRIADYAAGIGSRMGTTAVVMLLTQERYYILNVGDSRAYELAGSTRQITQDHSLVAREIAMGRLAPEEAETDKRRNYLLQCIGASERVSPDMFFGEVRPDAVYMLCSDGFRHKITPQEIYDTLGPERLMSYEDMNSAGAGLIELDMARGETDNISVVLVRTF